MDSNAFSALRQGLPKLVMAATAAMLLAGAALSASADVAVYKWVDPQGRIHYSDRPPPTDGKLLSVETTSYAHNRVAASERSAPQPQAAPSGGSNAAPAAKNAPPQLKQAVAADVANARAEQCKQAQDRYQTYVHSRRLYKEGANKERVYLSDAELETERLNAKRESDEACAGIDAR